MILPIVIGTLAALAMVVGVYVVARGGALRLPILCGAAVLTGFVTLLFAATMGPAVGLLAGVVLASLQISDAWGGARLGRLHRALTDPKRRMLAADSLVAELTREREGDAPGSDASVLEAAGHLLLVELDTHAEALLDMLDVTALEERHGATFQLYRSILHLRRGELDAARHWAFAPPQRCEVATRQGLTAVAALLSALQGEPELALVELTELPETAAHPFIEQLARSARAHALAATDEDAATHLMTTLADEQSWPTLDRIRAHAGPASALADRLLQEHVGPYR